MEPGLDCFDWLYLILHFFIETGMKIYEKV